MILKQWIKPEWKGFADPKICYGTACLWVLFIHSTQLHIGSWLAAGYCWACGNLTDMRSFVPPLFGICGPAESCSVCAKRGLVCGWCAFTPSPLCLPLETCISYFILTPFLEILHGFVFISCSGSTLCPVCYTQASQYMQILKMVHS